MLNGPPGEIYDSELLGAKRRLGRLKERLLRRKLGRGGRSADQATTQELRADGAEGSVKEEADLGPQSQALRTLRQLVAQLLLDPQTDLPISSKHIHSQLSQGPAGAQYTEALALASEDRAIEPVLRDLGGTAAGGGGSTGGEGGCLEAEEIDVGGRLAVMVLGVVNRGRLASMAGVPATPRGLQATGLPSPGRPAGAGGGDPSAGPLELENLLSRASTMERQKTEKGVELLGLIEKPTAKESAVVDRFRTEGGSGIREYCPHLTKEECRTANRSPFCCPRVHFHRLVFPWTDLALGNCSYLDTCHRIKSCKYVHYEVDARPDHPHHAAALAQMRRGVPKYLQALEEPQWINCDVRRFDLGILGKFGVVMADPPWSIHQDLPYGTMEDDEMRNLNLGCLQDEGVILLWVTGRAMELGRECLQLWGYNRVDELIWVKTNQLQRLIRTGRTGHWLNHSKEHCLVGIKGNPPMNCNVDCDVIVAEVRETSRKPDEMYPLLERLWPGTRKLEIFARPHNLRPGWVSLGNQLEGTWLVELELRARYEAKYGPLGD